MDRAPANEPGTASISRIRHVEAIANGTVVDHIPGAMTLKVATLLAGPADQVFIGANLRSARAQVDSAQAQLRSELTNLDRATIRSPVTGVVLARQVEPGQTVAASFNTPTLFEIAEDLSAMKLEVKVDEADVGQVSAGQRATFQVDAFPGRKELSAHCERVIRASLSLAG